MATNINYLNKDFNQFKDNLIEFAKTYFPKTYNDFSEASPGTMFIEMSSYVGDVLSFYTDTQIQENFVLTAKEKENLLNMAYSLGYRPKASYASVTTVDFYQRVPILNASKGLLSTNSAIITSEWSITDDDVVDDISINIVNGIKKVIISRKAFVYATPLIAELDGIKGRFFSKRLYNAVISACVSTAL